MKQIVVNVSGLTTEEKQCINKALAKIKLVRLCDPLDWDNVVAMYGVSRDGFTVGFDYYEALSPTHTPQQVLEMAGMDGHVHAENMALYAEDAKTHAEPWKLWQYKGGDGVWHDCPNHPYWGNNIEYRRKPKTKLIHGVEIPVFEFTPKVGERFYAANVGLPEFFEEGYKSPKDCTFTQRMIERGLLYPHTEEGKKAAILHSKAMLGV